MAMGWSLCQGDSTLPFMKLTILVLMIAMMCHAAELPPLPPTSKPPKPVLLSPKAASSQAVPMVILPPSKEWVFKFVYPPGIDKSKYDWYIEATQNFEYWFTVNAPMDTNGICTVKVEKDKTLFFRPKGVPKR